MDFRTHTGRAVRGLLIGLFAALSLSLALAGTSSAAPQAHIAAANASAASSSPAANMKRAARVTVRLLNRQRARHGLRPLRVNRKLSRSARRFSRSMVRHNFFAHVSPTGSTLSQRIRRAGYMRGAHRWHVGENLAWGGGVRSTPRAIVRSWMNSPGHRANILSSGYREIGIGIALGAPGYGGPAATYTTHFGARG
jgi:uncharacterized protein YkwD